MSDEPDVVAEGSPDADAWTEADEAMHRLLEAAFEAPGSLDDRPSTQELGPFPTAPPARPGTAAGRELSAGQTLGRFRIEGELGRGGFGVVYRATDTRLGRTVALKVPRPDRVQTTALWDRFAREARLAATLDHDAIVPVLDGGILGGTFVLVSAYQEGEPLSRWLAARHSAGAPPRLAADVALRLASGVRHAHQRGVLHRDLKPANVLMVRSPGRPEAWCPRITDFGLGTDHGEAEAATLTGFWQGSPPYMAPEQVLPDLGRVDARSDVYALGAILYELLAGRPIYPGSSLVELGVRLGRGEPPVRPRRLRPGLPADLETICLKCLERDPARRYPSAAALHEDLRRFLDGRPVLARPIPAWARLGRWARRRPSHAALVGLAIAATAVTAGLVIRHQRQLVRGNARLREAVAQRDSANAALRSTFDRLLASERASRRTAYATDLRLAERELTSGRVELAQVLLRRHEPAGGRDDLRDFAWHFLIRQATRTHSVHTLTGFRWWRGTAPLAPAPHGDDPLPTCDFFDPDGIRSKYLNRQILLGPRYLAFACLDDRGNALPNLWLSDGRRRVPLDLPGWESALGPGGHTLALVNPVRMGPAGEAPSLVRRPDLRLPHGGPGRGTEGRVRVVEVARASAVRFSGDGRTVACLASIAPDRAVPVLYDLDSDWRASYPRYETSVRIGKPQGEARRFVQADIALSHDGRLAALTGDRDRLRVFEARTGRTLWALGPEAVGPDVSVTCLAFDDRGTSLVTGDSGGRVRVWDAARGRLLSEFPTPVGFAYAVGFHPDAWTVAIVAGNEDAIRLWRYAAAPASAAPLDHGDEVWGLAYTRAGAALVSVGDDDRGKAWDPVTGESLRSYRASVLQSAVAADRTGDLVVVGDFDGLVTLRRGGLDGPALGTASSLLGTKVRAVALSPAVPGLLAAGGSGPRVLVATLDAGGRIVRERLLEAPHRDTYGLAFAPDAKTLAMGSHDHVITLWEVAGLRRRATLDARARVARVAFSPDGGTLVSGDTEGGLQFWDMPAGTLRATLPRASEVGGVWSLAFSPDGKTLATGGDDGMVRLWDPELALERLALSGHEAKVHAMAFAPDGETLASGDFAGKIRLWRAGP